MMLNNAINWIFCAVIFIITANSAWAQASIGYVNSDEIKKEYTAAVDAQRELEDMNKEWDMELQELNKEVQSLKEDIDSRSLLYSDEMKKEKRDQINSLSDQIRKFQKDKWGENGEYFRKQEELLKPVYEKIKEAIDQISEEKNLDIVFDTIEGNILFARPRLNITQDVLELLRSE